MTQTEEQTISSAQVQTLDMKLEVVVIPVADVERAKSFYTRLKWRLDADFNFDNGFRAVQFTPTGSAASVQFGTKMTAAAPGSAQNLYLVVSDIVAVRAQIAALGVPVSEVYHPAEPGAAYRAEGDPGRLAGVSPDRKSYGSFATFSDPDGNRWLLQEVTARIPGRIEASGAAFASPSDLEGGLRRAAEAHGEHEKRTGGHDVNWPAWYAAYLVAEQRGSELPS